MSTRIRTLLIVAVTLFVALAYSPASFADKKDNSNSNSNSNSDDNKKKDKNDDQNNQRQGRDRHRDDDQKQNTQQIKVFQGGQNNQSNSNNPQQILGTGQQNGPSMKSQQLQGIQKQQQWQNIQKQNNQQQNVQQLNNKNNWQMQSHKDHKELHNWVVQFGGPEPFSKQWYKDHPHAWHHDHDDTWKVVTAAGVFGFLGWQAYHPQGTVVVYEPLPYDRIFVSTPGVVIDPSRGDWMPLGVYSLMVGPGDASTRMLDMAIDRYGHIRGSYYDMISGASYNVAGIVDQRTQYAQWSLESNRQITFYTPMGELMQPQGVVNVQLPSGQRQQWQVVRMEGAGY